jgi:hypothetical protein
MTCNNTGRCVARVEHRMSNSIINEAVKTQKDRVKAQQK